MDYKVLYRKYRPCNFSQLIGQDNIKDILVNSIKHNKIAHAYIFTGPRGTGKTSTAKIFAKTLNCINNQTGISCDECEMCKSYVESPDIIEIDAASNNGVEEIRTLRDSVKIAPYNSKYKVYIIDEVHMLSNSAWNAFLKTLEEPPSHVVFILATTEVNKIPETVMSRCQRFDFSKICDDVMFAHLSNICKIENISIEDDALRLLIKLSDGCVRDALSYLDKVSKFEVDITEDLIEMNFGILGTGKLKELLSNLIDGDNKKISSFIDNVMESGLTPLNFVTEFINYLLDIVMDEIKLDFNIDKNDIKMIIVKLNNLVSTFNSIINPFILIKLELCTLDLHQQNLGNNQKNISREIIVENKDENVSNLKSNDNKKTNVEKNLKEIENDVLDDPEETKSKFDFENLRSIRINNSFCGASKEEKISFSDKWSQLIKKLSFESDYNTLGLIENAKIEVVSNTNVIFSFLNSNDSILFNNNLLNIEKIYNDVNNSNYKFFAISDAEWNLEKQNFIKNKDKKYEYMDENINMSNINESELENLAQDLFGEDIIEIG